MSANKVDGRKINKKNAPDHPTDGNRRANGTFAPGNIPAPQSHRWKPGQSGNPGGRPVGTKLRVTNAFLNDLADAWKEYGKTAMKEVATKEPAKFVTICANLVPRETNITHTAIDELQSMTPEQIEERIQQLRLKQSDEAKVIEGTVERT